MNDLLELLKEALEQLVNIWKVADDSVADYTLNIETAINFINRALRTQDRLDIFKALQKAHDVLEREEESYEDEEQDEYDNLVDRLKAALDGLNESVFMKESELKALTKAVLKEIYQEPHAPEEGGLFGLFQQMANTIKQTRPELTDIQKGHAMAHKLVSAMITDIKTMIRATLANKKKEFSDGVGAFEHHSSSLIAFMVSWAQEIYQEHPETRDTLDRPMNEVKDHLNQVGAQFKSVFLNLKNKSDLGKPNVINSLKELEHLNEIFANLKSSIDKIFQIGLESGYGKKK